MKEKLFVSIGTIVIFLYLLLSFKNPFVPRSLIGNLEPFPDTLYYAAPAWNFVHGNGFVMKFGPYEIKQVVPPLYSVYLISFFALFKDVRSFYFANQVLMLASILLFLILLRQLLKRQQPVLLLLLGLLLVTNFYFFTFPSLMMAENISIFVVLLALYMLMIPLTGKKVVIGSLLGVLLLLIKFSNAPVAGIFYLFFTLKVLREGKPFEKKIYLFLLPLAGLVFAAYLGFSRILVGHKNLQSGAGFSFRYFNRNLQFYLNILTGAESPMLWYAERFGNKLTFLLTIDGAAVGIMSRQLRYKTFVLLSFIASLILFMSFFVTPDARYISVVYPAILILAGVGLSVIFKGKEIVLTAVIGLLLFAYLFIPNMGYKNNERMIISLKKQIGLNFRHKEDPWYYLATQQFNAYFKELNDKNAYLATVLPPFYVDFYSNHMFRYLPLTHHQEFFGVTSELSLQMKIPESVPEYFRTLMKQNRHIYITNAYINNLSSWKKDYSDVMSQFNTKLVKEGCMGVCNIYELLSN